MKLKLTIMHSGMKYVCACDKFITNMNTVLIQGYTDIEPLPGESSMDRLLYVIRHESGMREAYDVDGLRCEILK